MKALPNAFVPPVRHWWCCCVLHSGRAAVAVALPRRFTAAARGCVWVLQVTKPGNVFFRWLFLRRAAWKSNRRCLLSFSLCYLLR